MVYQTDDVIFKIVNSKIWVIISPGHSVDQCQILSGQNFRVCLKIETKKKSFPWTSSSVALMHLCFQLHVSALEKWTCLFITINSLMLRSLKESHIWITFNMTSASSNRNLLSHSIQHLHFHFKLSKYFSLKREFFKFPLPTLERSPSYKEFSYSKKMTEKRQRPTPDAFLIELSIFWKCPLRES